ncbi:hypothetical protein EJB05_12038, partial [Eragrostis curvula]
MSVPMKYPNSFELSSNTLNEYMNIVSPARDSYLHSATGTAGTGPDKVYGAVLCRGDTAPGTDCASRLIQILDTAINNSDSTSCSTQKSITLFQDEYQAQITISDQDFISSFSNAPDCIVRANLNPPPVSDTDSEQFDYLVSTLMIKLTDTMASKTARYLTGQGWLTETRQTVYWLVQCTEDMPKQHCQDCLNGIIANRTQMVGHGQLGGAILGLRCSLWYQTDVQFFTGKPMFSIKEATGNFSSENKLGQGGFGTVYKGLLPGGLEVAVKRLAACSVQGLLEFKNEIQLIAKLQHKNLVKLLGCCIQGDQEKMLVYEYMQNKSLDFFIFGMFSIKFCPLYKIEQLNWPICLHIIDGIAQGIVYLHKHSRLCVVHRDLKASNILLDHDMTPKISDFGIARIFSSNMTEENTTRIVGTQYAWKLWKTGEWRQLVCCHIGSEHQEIERYIQVALLCLQDSAEDRPVMDHVLTMLSSENVNLPKPKQPAYFYVRCSEPEISSCDISITITLPRYYLSTKFKLFEYGKLRIAAHEEP